MKKKSWGNVAFGMAGGFLLNLPVGAFVFEWGVDFMYMMFGAAIFMTGIGLIIEEIRKLKP